jgi:flagellar biosynthesis protein FlhG
MQIIPIASGKGGVGKTLVATNLAVALARYGKRVVLADLDLGASNLHLTIGQSGVRTGIGTFLLDSNIKFDDIILPTEYDNLRFIPGDAEIPGMANLKSGQKSKLIRRLYSVDADYLVADLGAGTNYNTLDFFLTSSRGMVVTTPTLTATLNAYLFLKNTVFRLMGNSFKKGTAAAEYLKGLQKEGAQLQRVYIPRLLQKIKQEDPQSFEQFQESMQTFRPMMVMNMLEDPKDSKKAEKIRRSCREYLGIDMEHLGVIYFDHLQEVAQSSRLPIVAYKPNSVLSQAVFRLADKIIQHQEEEQSGLLDFDNLEQTYETAEMEAEIDFDAKVQDLENLLHSGALTRGDLIDTIRAQQYDVNALKKENQLLKSKLLKAMEQGYKV